MKRLNDAGMTLNRSKVICMQLNLTPQWKISMVEEKGRHNYSVDGEATFYPGVTTILGIADKAALVPWAAKVTADYLKPFIYAKPGDPEDESLERIEEIYQESKKAWRNERDKAADLGTRFHELMEDPSMDVPTDLEIAMKSANLWLKNTKLRLVRGRTKIISKQYGFGGEWDALMQNSEGKLVVVDFKSGKRLYESAAAQCAAYGIGAVDTFNLSELPNGLVVRFGKEKVEFEEKEVLNMESSFQYFKACLDLYNKSSIHQFGASRIMKEKKEKAKNETIKEGV